MSIFGECISSFLAKKMAKVNIIDQFKSAMRITFNNYYVLCQLSAGLCQFVSSHFWRIAAG